jgi:hypothetical protein
MLNITAKTPRAALVTEIERLKLVVDNQSLRIDCQVEDLRLANRDYENAQHKIAQLETDRDSLLGALRVMADSSREVRIRKSSVRDADMAYALPSTNTDKL